MTNLLRVAELEKGIPVEFLNRQLRDEVSRQLDDDVRWLVERYTQEAMGELYRQQDGTIRGLEARVRELEGRIADLEVQNAETLRALVTPFEGSPTESNGR